jgi:RND family efflux transporter MFP subunit
MRAVPTRQWLSTSHKQIATDRFRWPLSQILLSSLRAQEEHQAALQALEKGMIAREEDLDAKEAEVRGLEGRVVEAQIQLGGTTLHAPYDGVIAQRFVEQNQNVRAKEPIVKFQDVDEIDIVVEVPETFMSAVMRSADIVAMVAEFTGAPGLQFPVHIKEIEQRADPVTQTLKVRVAMKAPTDLNVLPGMTATVTLTYRRANILGDRILVPLAAVLKDAAGEQVAWLVGADHLVSRAPVKLGTATGGQIEIVEGLPPGDRIAVAGVPFLAGRDEGARLGRRPRRQLAMNVGELSVRNNRVVFLAMALAVVGGVVAYQQMGRLEDPEFTIKEALIITPYLGASAEEVAQEVTNPIESACQQLGQLKRVESESTRGRSLVRAAIKDRYDKYRIPQVWDELRRKIADVQPQLPPSVRGQSLVIDDFGDVYGIFLAITGDGYSFPELRRFAEFLRRELQLVPNVKKVELFGAQQEVVFLEISRQRLAQRGINEEQIYTKLQAKNLAADGGNVRVGDQHVALDPQGGFNSAEEMLGLVIGSGRQLLPRDVGTVERGDQDPPRRRPRYDGKPSIGLGISTVQGGNIQARLSGPDPAKLRELGARVKKVLRDDGGALCERSDWRERSQAIRPNLLELQARRNGIDRVDVARTLATSFEGRPVGFYRAPGSAGTGTFPQETRLLPIIARPPVEERSDVNAIHSLQIWSPIAGRMIPLSQVASGAEVVWEEPVVMRRDRFPTLTVHADPRTGLPSQTPPAWRSTRSTPSSGSTAEPTRWSTRGRLPRPA